MRFIKEYANYLIKSCKDNDLMIEEIKKEKIEQIEKYVRFQDRGLMTINECMRALTEL